MRPEIIERLLKGVHRNLDHLDGYNFDYVKLCRVTLDAAKLRVHAVGVLEGEVNYALDRCARLAVKFGW